MKNIEIRQYAAKRRVSLWEISERLGYSHESAFSRVLRHELSGEKKSEIMRAIDEIAQEETR